jgi:hypothetical protein
VAQWPARVRIDPEKYREKPVRRRLTQVSAPLVIGGTSAGGGGALIGFRPELVTSWTTEYLARRRRGLGFGVYGELLYGAGGNSAGGGLTFLAGRQPYAIGPSVGLYHQWADSGDHMGVAASLYTGLRFFEFEHFDLPFGVRTELRYGLGNGAERAIAISLDLDVAIAGVLLEHFFLSTLDARSHRD